MAGTFHRDAVRFGNTEIAYKIRRSRERKTLGITVCGPWVEVAAPAGMRASAIRPLVLKKGAWILQKLDLARRHAPIYPQVLKAGDSIRFFGRQYLLRIHKVEGKRSWLEQAGGRFHLYLADPSNPDVGHQLFKRWFREQLQLALPQWIEEFSKKLGIEPPPFDVRELGSRWGSCSASRKIRFHWLLTTQTPEFARHVVAHELCHLIDPTHSAAFLQLLKRINPSGF